VQTLKVDAQTANLLIAGSLIIGTPFFVICGALSDKIGRKPIIMAGCIIAALTYFPIFKGLTHFANPDLEAAQKNAPVTVIADPNSCSFQFNPVGTSKFVTSCDIAKSFLAKSSVNYANVAAPAGTVASIHIGDVVIDSFEGNALTKDELKKQTDEFGKSASAAIKAAGYPPKADPEKVNKPMVLVLLTLLVLYVTMVYGPIAAWLVELFPTRIRYTSMSLPYHIGNGWFGGFLPTTAFAMVAATGDIYYGLWYPIIVALMTAVLGIFFLPETKDRDIHHI
jgi:MFS family permease